jgi:outer membrane protein assembly factor BamB
MKSNLILAAALLACSAIFPIDTACAQSGDWPHWMGPNRDNTWEDNGIIDSFPEGGPGILWRTPIGSGYSGPAVASGKVVITDLQTDGDFTQSNFERNKLSGTERVLCLDEKDGHLLWKHETPVTYAISYPAGPRCTAVIDEDLVYTLGAEGHLICFRLDSGDVVWERELKSDYKTTSALWGYAGHPLIDGNHLITLAGGEGSHVVALDKKTGEEVWRSLTAKEQGYSPPVIISAAGLRQLVVTSPQFVAAVDPESGKELWSVDYEATSGSIIMTPIQIGDYLYAGGYSNKSLLLKLGSDKPSAEIVWSNKARDAISPVNVQPFLDQENSIMFGMHQNGQMRATQFPEGTLLWETPKPASERPNGNETAFIVRHGDRFWLFNDSGELVIARMTAKGYEEIDRARVIEPTNKAFNRPVVWSMPAFANRHAYIRNDKEIICVDLAR